MLLLPAAAIVNIVDRETLAGWTAYCIMFCCRALQSGFVLRTVCMYCLYVGAVCILQRDENATRNARLLKHSVGVPKSRRTPTIHRFSDVPSPCFLFFFCFLLLPPEDLHFPSRVYPGSDVSVLARPCFHIAAIHPRPGFLSHFCLTLNSLFWR